MPKNETWKILDKNYDVIKHDLPFTHMEMSGIINNGRYHIISGYINNNDIAYIKLNFLNGLLVKLEKSEANSYAYVIIDEEEGSVINKIEGYSTDGKLIYQYNW